MGSAALPLGLTGISCSKRHSWRLQQLPSTSGLLGWACPKLATRRMFRGLYDNPVTSFPFTLDWDPFEDLLSFGLKPSRSRQQSSLKQDVKELPCADCRGRGYLSCNVCDINSPNASCLQCAGKGTMTCRQCQGERVVQGNSVSVHEKLHSDSSRKVKDDEAIENMPVKRVRKKRVYGPLSAATRAKISHALKEFERRTGGISSRMNKIHQDPVRRAQWDAAIKKAVEARKQRSPYYSNPENRSPYKCSICHGSDHNARTCPQRAYKCLPIRCRTCHGSDHNSRTCPQSAHKTPIKCSICHGSDHNSRTCPQSAHKTPIKCSICKQLGHNKTSCNRHKQEDVRLEKIL